MSEEELKALWTRWMHRNDIAADTDDVFAFASAASVDRMMNTNLTIEIILAEAGQIVFHAGMMYLAELVQDDNQLQRETMKFATTADAFQMRKTLIEAPAPQMVAPYVATRSSGRAL